MNLEEVRHLFRSISGRYDLTEADAGKAADFYINEGAKWLDRQDETHDSWASYMAVLTADTWYVQFPSCRAIKEVWLATVSNGRWQLEKKNLQDLLYGYYTDPVGESVSGAPNYFSPSYARYIPEPVSAGDLTTFSAYINLAARETYGYNTLVLSCPVDENTLIDVRGLFYSATLTEDVDTNYWSAEHPLLLAMATIRQIHMSSGNMASLKNIDDALRREMKDLGMDLIEQLISEVDQMEG